MVSELPFQELAKNGGVVNDDIISKTVDKMFVLFGCEILKIVPGKTFIPSLLGKLATSKILSLNLVQRLSHSGRALSS